MTCGLGAPVHSTISYRIVCTIIAPTPFVAAIFITFGHLVHRLGGRYSWLNPRFCESLFTRAQYDPFLTVSFRRLQDLLVGGKLHSHRQSISAANSGPQDITSLVVQAAGGGIASSANTVSGTNLVRMVLLTSYALYLPRLL